MSNAVKSKSRPVQSVSMFRTSSCTSFIVLSVNSDSDAIVQRNLSQTSKEGGFEQGNLWLYHQNLLINVTT